LDEHPFAITFVVSTKAWKLSPRNFPSLGKFTLFFSKPWKSAAPFTAADYARRTPALGMPNLDQQMSILDLLQAQRFSSPMAAPP
jgi:hypothetical protein